MEQNLTNWYADQRPGETWEDHQSRVNSTHISEERPSFPLEMFAPQRLHISKSRGLPEKEPPRRMRSTPTNWRPCSDQRLASIRSASIHRHALGNDTVGIPEVWDRDTFANVRGLLCNRGLCKDLAEAVLHELKQEECTDPDCHRIGSQNCATCQQNFCAACAVPCTRCGLTYCLNTCFRGHRCYPDTHRCCPDGEIIERGLVERWLLSPEEETRFERMLQEMAQGKRPLPAASRSRQAASELIQQRSSFSTMLLLD